MKAFLSFSLFCLMISCNSYKICELKEKPIQTDTLNFDSKELIKGNFLLHTLNKKVTNEYGRGDIVYQLELSNNKQSLFSPPITMKEVSLEADYSLYPLQLENPKLPDFLLVLDYGVGACGELHSKQLFAIENYKIVPIYAYNEVFDAGIGWYYKYEVISDKQFSIKKIEVDFDENYDGNYDDPNAHLKVVYSDSLVFTKVKQHWEKTYQAPKDKERKEKTTFDEFYKNS